MDNISGEVLLREAKESCWGSEEEDEMTEGLDFGMGCFEVASNEVMLIRCLLAYF
jgi:hypothetical protein